MPELDEFYYTSVSLDEYFVDKDTGLPLANGKLFFFRDADRSTAKTVFQLSGTFPNYTYVALPNPVDLSAVGTPINASNENVSIYYRPFITNSEGEQELDLYYVRVEAADNTVQFEREAWPNVTSANDPENDAFRIENLISNPQFTRIFFNQNIASTISVTGATNQIVPIAPDWVLDISGTGSVIINRVAVSGLAHIPTSPPYVLDVTVSGGVTECKLRQRMMCNSGLWASTNNDSIFLTGSITGINQNVGDVALTMFYEESTGGVPIQIVGGNVSHGAYSSLQGVTADPIPESNNTDLGMNGYIDIYVDIPQFSNVRISSIQVLPTVNSSEISSYNLRSSNREQALMGDYFLPALESKQVDPLTTGWDFPMNPAQFGTSGNVVATAQYIWDQTILQSTGDVAFTTSPLGGLQLTTNAASLAFGLLQYLPLSQAQRLAGQILSVNINAYKALLGDDVTVRVYLFRGNAAATFPTLPTTLGTFASASSGVFTLTAVNWTEIARGGIPTASGTLFNLTTSSERSPDNDLRFTNWELTDAAEIDDTNKGAILVTFECPSTSTVITVDSISLTPNRIPSRPAPKTFTEVLKDCQHFYEKSKDFGVLITTPDVGSALIAQQEIEQIGTVQLHKRSFGFRFRTAKLSTNATVNVYAEDGTINSITAYIYRNGAVVTSGTFPITNWSARAEGNFGIQYIPANSTNILSTPIVGALREYEAFISYHFTADDRLGI